MTPEQAIEVINVLKMLRIFDAPNLSDEVTVAIEAFEQQIPKKYP